MGIFTSSNIISENGITGTTIEATNINSLSGITSITLDTVTINATTVDATTISGDTFYGDGGGLVNVPSIYTQNNTIGTNRVAIIADSLTWSGGSETRVVNSRKIKEVTQASDIPTS